MEEMQGTKTMSLSWCFPNWTMLFQGLSPQALSFHQRLRPADPDAPILQMAG